MFPAGSSPAAGPVGRKDPPNRPFERGGKNQMHTLRASQSKSCVHTYACGGGRPGFAGRVGGEPSRVVVPQPPPACFAATDTRNPFARCEASGLREQAVLSWVSGCIPGKGEVAEAGGNSLLTQAARVERSWNVPVGLTPHPLLRGDLPTRGK